MSSPVNPLHRAKLTVRGWLALTLFGMGVLVLAGAVVGAALLNRTDAVSRLLSQDIQPARVAAAHRGRSGPAAVQRGRRRHRTVSSVDGGQADVLVEGPALAGVEVFRATAFRFDCAFACPKGGAEFHAASRRSGGG